MRVRVPRSPQRLVALAFGIACTALLLTAALTLFLALRQVRQADTVLRTELIQQHLEEVLRGAVDAETGERGYVITGLPAFLEPYEDARGAVRRALAALDTLIADSLQRARLPDLRLRTDHQLDTLERIVSLRRDSGLAAASRFIAMGAGKLGMDSLRGLVSLMAERQSSLLDQRTGTLHEARRRTLAAITVLSILATALLWLAYRRLLRTEEYRREAEAARAKAAEELRRSNTELQRFAYVASHDLQEPLRMVASFTQLLAKRYQGRLDATADEYIGFAVDGAKRMQQLIADLLEYSRVGTEQMRRGPVEMTRVVDEATSRLTAVIRESGASVTHDALPAVGGDRARLEQLLQNLIGNALKYRKPGTAPAVHVSAAREEDGWHFTVRDNGIGIPPEHHEKIFQMFQRLHGRDQYAGTGIGLAICQRIVEAHGGRIWVTSTPGEGTTFHFTLGYQAA
jgi:signal transduction histidine kinase